MIGKTILSVDPGRDKCGVAALNIDGTVLYQRVVETAAMPGKISRLKREYEADILVIGNGTTSSEAQEHIKGECPELQIVEMDEYFTTQLARREYWKVKPPRGWRKLLPTSMQEPPEPVDDFVAVILARRYLEEHSKK
ncbi:Resolvase, RNase H domain protein [Anaerovibrio sp. JC8]|nr:Resolvase, RNase H domain protein [Anaerovibrio sp. JC8]